MMIVSLLLHDDTSLSSFFFTLKMGETRLKLIQVHRLDTKDIQTRLPEAKTGHIRKAEHSPQVLGKSKADGWLSECQISISREADLLAFSRGDALVIVRSATEGIQVETVQKATNPG